MAETQYITLKQRKAARVAEMERALVELRGSLAAYARAAGGRFVLYGSSVRGGPRYDSDTDILVDFPAEARSAAWRFAEDECWRLGLEPDIRPLAWCGAEFLAAVLPGAVVLGDVG